MFLRPGEATQLRGSGNNTPVVLTIPGVARTRHFLSKVIFSYDADPTGGLLTIDVGAVSVLTLPITVGGPGPIGLNIKSDPGGAITITLSAGGSGINGHLFAEYAKLPA